MEFDHVLRIIGEFGPHQRRLYALLNLSLIPAAFQLLLQVFVGAEPSWVCVNSSSNETCPKNKSHCLDMQYTSKFTSIVTEVSQPVFFKIYESRIFNSAALVENQIYAWQIIVAIYDSLILNRFLLLKRKLQPCHFPLTSVFMILYILFISIRLRLSSLFLVAKLCFCPAKILPPISLHVHCAFVSFYLLTNVITTSTIIYSIQFNLKCDLQVVFNFACFLVFILFFYKFGGRD